MWTFVYTLIVGILLVLLGLGAFAVRGRSAAYAQGYGPGGGHFAACYGAVISRYETAEYVCAVCGERTVHRGEAATTVSTVLPACLRLAESMPRLRIHIDASQFCAHCRPGVDDPKLVAEITFAEGARPLRAVGVREEDLRRVQEVLAANEAASADSLRPQITAALNVDSPSREELAARLAELAKDDTPVELRPGAMCYSPAGPGASAEYICPKCGERTVYDGMRAWQVSWNLVGARRMVDTVQGIRVELLENEFCRKCQPEVTQPRLGLAIHLRDEDMPRIVWDVSPDDIDLLAEFMAGERKHSDTQDFESPLRDHISRLAEILGIDASRTGPGPGG